MDHTLVTNIAICIVAAWVLAVGFNAVGQPVLLAYLAAGFALGPHGFGWVPDRELIATISSLGLILLLFMIGLEIDLKRMLNAGRVITVTAAVQILGGFALGMVFFRVVVPVSGWLEVVYLAVAATLSSTVIVVKLLHDKRELETLTGRVTLGLLVVQDLFAILFLAVQPNLADPSLGVVAWSFGKVLLLIAVAFLVSRYLLPPVFATVARLPELVLVGALAWCFALAGLADLLGLSREMGALVAGVAVSTFPYTLDVAAKVTSLRDFFVTLFFVALGMSIPAPTWGYLGWMLAWAAFVVGSRLATVFPPLYAMRQGHRGSLLPAVNLGQISELSLVILALGRDSGEVSEHSLSCAAYGFSFLAVGSTYAIVRSDPLLRRFSPWLTRLGIRDLDNTPPAGPPARRAARIYLLGFSWTASSLLEELRRQRPALIDEIRVIDFNPLVYERLLRQGVSVVYGDITHREVLLHAGVHEAQILICSIPNTLLKGATNLGLLKHLREVNPRASIVMHAERLADVAPLYAAGASHVSVPRLLEATDLLRIIDASEHQLLEQERKALEARLADRDEVVP